MPDNAERMAALHIANNVRRQSAVLAHDVRRLGRRDGALLAVRIIHDGVSPIHVGRLLNAVYGIGQVKREWMLTRTRIDGASRVADVGPHRRRLLANLLLVHAEQARRSAPDA
jgi:hypothetical protein